MIQVSILCHRCARIVSHSLMEGSKGSLSIMLTREVMGHPCFTLSDWASGQIDVQVRDVTETPAKEYAEYINTLLTQDHRENNTSMLERENRQIQQNAKLAAR